MQVSDNVRQAITDQIEALQNNSYDQDCFALIRAAVEYDAILDSDDVEETMKSLIEEAVNVERIDQEYVREMLDFCENQGIEIDDYAKDNLFINKLNTKAGTIAHKVMAHIADTTTANVIASEIKDLVFQMSEYLENGDN